MKFNLKIYSFLIFLLSLMTSCVANKKYERDANVVDEKLFRTDLIPKDSLGIANLSWREIFTDPILQGYINKALINNLDIRIAAQNILSAESYLKQAKNNYFPTINVGPNYSFVTQSLNTQFGRIIGERRYIHQFDLTGSINWELDIWGKLSAQQRAQMATYLSSIAAHQSLKTDLVASIATSYYQLLTFDEQKKSIKETIEIRKKNLETTKALKLAGTLTEVAVQQSEALVYNAEALLVNIDVQIELLENTMSLLMGEPSQKINRSTLKQQHLPIDYNLGYATSLLSNRPDVRMAEFQLMNAFELTNVVRAQFYPMLRIAGSSGLQSIDIDDYFSVNSFFANIVSGFLQPVLNKRQIRTQYEVANIEKEKAYINFRKSILTAGKEVSDALKTYSAQDEFIKLKEKELIAYQKSEEFSQELVNYGMANYLEVLNASVNSLNAELNITNAQFIKMQAGIELYKALGGGWK